MPKMSKPVAKSTTPVLTPREKAGLAKIRLVARPPLTPAQAALVKHGYPERQVREMSHPEERARHECGAGLSDWAARFEAGMARDRLAYAGRAAARRTEAAPRPATKQTPQPATQTWSLADE